MEDRDLEYFHHTYLSCTRIDQYGNQVDIILQSFEVGGKMDLWVNQEDLFEVLWRYVGMLLCGADGSVTSQADANQVYELRMLKEALAAVAEGDGGA